MEGSTLGRYTIIRKLGSGGMGDVYLARDASLDRPVAIKILPANFSSDPDRLRRFLQEAKAASSLSDPGVAHIYEIGESDGVHFIAMEYVEGETLDSQCQSPANPAEIVEIGVQLAEALDAAHSRGIIHRDLKPGNIMVTPRGRIKILDFGLAKVTAPASPAEASALATQTAAGMVMGTVPYMSPEQALGRSVDARSDLFSMGVVLYHMATGRLPFGGKMPTEIVNNIVHSQPEAIGRFNYNVPPELERIVRKCLEKEPENRYQSARDLLVDLRNLRRDSSPITAAQKYQKPLTRRTLPLYAGMLFIAVLAAVSIWIFQSARTTRISKTEFDSLAVLPFVNSSQDPNNQYLSDGLTESIIKDLSQVSRLKVLAPAAVARYNSSKIDPLQAGRELKVAAILTGKVQRTGDTLVVNTDLVNVADGTELWGETYNKPMMQVLELQKDISHEIADSLRIKLTGEEKKLVTRLYTANPEAYEYYLKGRYYWNQRTEEGLKKGIENFRMAIQMDPNYALAYSGIADSYSIDMAPFSEQERKEKSLEAALKATQLDPNLAEAHTALGGAIGLTDMNAAFAEFQRAISLNPNYATAHQWYAEGLASLKRNDEALFEITRAMQADPLSMIVNATGGQLNYFAHRYDTAIEILRRTLELHPDSQGTALFLAKALEQKGDFPGAIQVIYQTVKKMMTTDDQRQELEKIKKDLDSSYASRGPQGYWETVLSVGLRQQTSNFELASLYAQLGDRDQAFQRLEKAVSQHENISELNREPRFDKIRPDPRYAALCKRLNLVP